MTEQNVKLLSELGLTKAANKLHTAVTLKKKLAFREVLERQMSAQRRASILDGSLIPVFRGEPLMVDHFGQVRKVRKAFKQYSKEEFRDMSKSPIIKDIMTGSTKLSEEEIKVRVNEHVDQLLNHE